MKYLCSTVAVKDDLTKEVLRSKLLSADICISDLDRTDTKNSPAEDLAKRRIGVSSTPYGVLKFGSWAFWTGACFLSAYSCIDQETAIETVKEQRFAAYETAFLREQTASSRKLPFHEQISQGYCHALKEEVQQEIASLFNRTYVAKSLFLGVREFYQALPARKMYLSRNIFPLVKAYADYLGCSDFKAEVKNKANWLEHLILNNPSWKRMILRIDGVAEDEMINRARFYQRQKWSSVEDVLVIKRSLKMKDDFKKSDVLISTNDFGLVGIMNASRIPGNWR